MKLTKPMAQTEKKPTQDLFFLNVSCYRAVENLLLESVQEFKEMPWKFQRTVENGDWSVKGRTVGRTERTK